MIGLAFTIFCVMSRRKLLLKSSRAYVLYRKHVKLYFFSWKIVPICQRTYQVLLISIKYFLEANFRVQKSIFALACECMISSIIFAETSLILQSSLKLPRALPGTPVDLYATRLDFSVVFFNWMNHDPTIHPQPRCGCDFWSRLCAVNRGNENADFPGWY